MNTPTPADIAPRYRDRTPRRFRPVKATVRRRSWLHEDHTLTYGLQVTIGRHGAHLTLAQACELRDKLNRQIDRGKFLDANVPSGPEYRTPVSKATPSTWRRQPDGQKGVRLLLPVHNPFFTAEDARHFMDQIEDALEALNTREEPTP